jgi:hypothetical protein
MPNIGHLPINYNRLIYRSLLTAVLVIFEVKAISGGLISEQLMKM